MKCVDMEISYYYECFSYKAEYVPKCLEVDFVSAEFVFDMSQSGDISFFEVRKGLRDPTSLALALNSSPECIIRKELSKIRSQ